MIDHLKSLIAAQLCIIGFRVISLSLLFDDSLFAVVFAETLKALVADGTLVFKIISDGDKGHIVSVHYGERKS